MKATGKKTLSKLEIDYDSMKEAEKELGDKVGKILTAASLKCDKYILEAEAKCNEILKSYGGKVIIKHNVNYNIVEKQ